MREESGGGAGEVRRGKKGKYRQTSDVGETIQPCKQSDRQTYT